MNFRFFSVFTTKRQILWHLARLQYDGKSMRSSKDRLDSGLQYLLTVLLIKFIHSKPQSFHV